MNNQSESKLFTIMAGTLVSKDQLLGTVGQKYEQRGNVIDHKYEILELLGEGGMGAVYKARHLMLEKDVALKTFRSTNLTVETCTRFQREAQSIAKLNHENIIQIFDYGLSEGGVPYYTMEYLEGRSLADRIKLDGPLAVPDTLRLFEQICSGLAAAHRRGIIHRDLKPANIFLTKTNAISNEVESVKIVDFGIASLINNSTEGQRLTAIGDVFGSPLYMSPEQSAGQAVTESADIYSLGCTLFEALIGMPPYCGANAMETIMMHHTASPPTLGKASGGMNFPSSLEKLVAKMLEKTPEFRPADMNQVAVELLQLRQSNDFGNHSVIWTQAGLEREGDRKELVRSSSPGVTRHFPSWMVPSLILTGVTVSLTAYFCNKEHTITIKKQLLAQPSGQEISVIPTETRLEASDKASGSSYRQLTLSNDIDDPLILMRQGEFAQAELVLTSRLEAKKQSSGTESRAVAEIMESLALRLYRCKREIVSPMVLQLTAYTDRLF